MFVEGMEIGSVILRPMSLDDIPDAMGLSSTEGWNQTEKDWQLLIESPANICWLAEKEKKVIGTTTAINYLNDEAWIGMVLVDKGYRGLGVSKSLLTRVFKELDFCRSIKLDATPAGQLVYQKFGFKDEYMIARMVNTSLNDLADVEYDLAPEPIQSDCLDAIVAFDESVFGVNRRQLIEFLIKEYPGKAWLLRRDNKIAGFILGRDGRKYHQIGPLLATNTNDARILILKAMGWLTNKPVVMDVLCDKGDLMNWLKSVGFVQQRHFIRMYKDENIFPGAINRQYIICGPEFG